MRVFRKNVDGLGNSQTTPMLDVEPILLEFCLQLDRMNQSIDKKTFLLLANSLIRGTQTERKVIDWKHKHLGYDKNATSADLGSRYYYQFLKRHSDQLWSSSPKALDIQRT